MSNAAKDELAILYTSSAAPTLDTMAQAMHHKSLEIWSDKKGRSPSKKLTDSVLESLAEQIFVEERARAR